MALGLLPRFGRSRQVGFEFGVVQDPVACFSATFPMVDAPWVGKSTPRCLQGSGGAHTKTFFIFCISEFHTDFSASTLQKCSSLSSLSSTPITIVYSCIAKHHAKSKRDVTLSHGKIAFFAVFYHWGKDANTLKALPNCITFWTALCFLQRYITNN